MTKIRLTKNQVKDKLKQGILNDLNKNEIQELFLHHNDFRQMEQWVEEYYAYETLETLQHDIKIVLNKEV